MTEGMKSSEFWMTIVTMGGGILLQRMGADVAVIGAVCGVGMSYIASRGIRKINKA